MNCFFKSVKNFQAFLLVLFFTTGGHSQDVTNCNCEEQINFVVNYIENNSPAFQVLKKKKKQLKHYRQEKKKYLEDSKDAKDVPHCLSILQAYVHLIKDHHTNIYSLNNASIQSNASNTTSIARPYDFQEIDDSTNYVKIASFAGIWEKSLNHFYDSIANFLLHKPHLVLDLRDNGGGNDACYYKLMPFIYTNPIKVDDVDVWVSPENLKLYSSLYSDNKTLIANMKAAKLYSFVSISKNERWKMDSITTMPKRVIILQNEKMASSAEDFVLYASQSSKVTTMGSNTGGYTGYGNVMSVKTPQNLFQLQTTTTRYKNGSQYEFTGIPPHVPLHDFYNWKDSVRKYLKKER